MRPAAQPFDSLTRGQFDETVTEPGETGSRIGRTDLRTWFVVVVVAGTDCEIKVALDSVFDYVLVARQNNIDWRIQCLLTS
jgi:hypothetical protein